MGEMQKVRTGRHCVFVMNVHLVFVTKFRLRVFTDAHLTRMEEIMRSVCADFECELVEFNGEDNHVHLLVNFPPKVAASAARGSRWDCRSPSSVPARTTTKPSPRARWPSQPRASTTTVRVVAKSAASAPFCSAFALADIICSSSQK
jgi:hypothetical protein